MPNPTEQKIILVLICALAFWFGFSFRSNARHEHAVSIFDPRAAHSTGDISEWGTHEVENWVSILPLKEKSKRRLIKTFRKHNVDGVALESMTEKSLTKEYKVTQPVVRKKVMESLQKILANRRSSRAQGRGGKGDDDEDDDDDDEEDDELDLKPASAHKVPAKKHHKPKAEARKPKPKPKSKPKRIESDSPPVARGGNDKCPAPELKPLRLNHYPDSVDGCDYNPGSNTGPVPPGNQHKFHLTWDNYPKCVRHVDSYREQRAKELEELEADPEYNTERGVIIFLAGTGDYWRSMVGGIESIDKYFNDFFHYPIIVFHTNMNEAAQNEVRSKTRSKISFEKVTFQAPTDWMLNKEPIPPSLFNNNMEYRHMNSFFTSWIYDHPAIKKYRYMLRLDADIKFIMPINYDIFKFMEDHDMLYGHFRWGIDADFVCFGLWEATQEYQRMRVCPKRPLTVHRFNFPGFFSLQRLDFFRSVEYKTWVKYIECLGGIYHQRWCDQEMFPLSLSLLVDEPHMRIHHFADIRLSHADGGPYAPFAYTDNYKTAPWPWP